jgi:5-methylcytosine-specific restriction enzyme A
MTISLAAERQLDAHPMCGWCLQQGRITIAVIADPALGHTWQSLCRPCHERNAAPNERGYLDDVGTDGLPVDPRHPWGPR